MKRETKLVVGASIVALSLVCVPLLITKVRKEREAELLNKKPDGTTRRFREAVRETTYIRVFFGVPELDVPTNQLSPSTLPHKIIRGEQAIKLLWALHFGGEDWYEHNGPYAGHAGWCTTLKFCSGRKTLAELHVGDSNRRKARWYKPPTYIGDSKMLPESRDFLIREFGQNLDTH